MYWSMGDLRDEGLGVRSFLGVAVVSNVRGNALLIKVENESMIMRLVLGRGKTVVGWTSSAIRWASVGVQK